MLFEYLKHNQLQEHEYAIQYIVSHTSFSCYLHILDLHLLLGLSASCMWGWTFTSRGVEVLLAWAVMEIIQIKDVVFQGMYFIVIYCYSEDVM